MKKVIKNILSTFNKRAAGMQGTLFLVFAIMSFVVHNSNKFWMFIIASVLFTGLQAIIDELRTLNNKNNK